MVVPSGDGQDVAAEYWAWCVGGTTCLKATLAAELTHVSVHQRLSRSQGERGAAGAAAGLRRKAKKVGQAWLQGRRGRGKRRGRQRRRGRESRKTKERGQKRRVRGLLIFFVHLK